MSTNPNRLKWLCRRGMKELDILMEHYLLHTYPNASTERQQAFKILLEYQDPIILDLLFSRIEDNNPDIQALIDELKNCQTALNQSRSRSD